MLSHQRQNLLLLGASVVFSAGGISASCSFWSPRRSSISRWPFASQTRTIARIRGLPNVPWSSASSSTSAYSVSSNTSISSWKAPKRRCAQWEQGSLWTLRVILPVGISFYTFQSMSYTIDVYRRRMPATRRPLDFIVFVSFFPQLIAGPIERATRLLRQENGRGGSSRRHRAGAAALRIRSLSKGCDRGHSRRDCRQVLRRPRAYTTVPLAAGLLCCTRYRSTTTSPATAIWRGGLRDSLASN